jgi:heme A synthase
MSMSTYHSTSARGTAAPVRPLFVNLALVTLASTILLILVGSIVRVSGHGLGCPDWPLCYGRPIPPFVTGAWVEFSHRLVAGIVALEVTALVVLGWRHYRAEPWLWLTAAIALFTVVIQASLGGIHVLYELPSWTGWTHTGVAMALVGLVAVLVAETRPGLLRLRAEAGALSLALITVVAAATYLLLLTGSLVTRTGSSLACPAFPHCGLDTVTDQLQSFVWIQMAHRLTAFTVAILVGLVVWRLWAAGRSWQPFAYALIGLVLFQFGFGISNVVLALPIWSRALHLVTGAAIWVTMVLLWTTVYRARHRHTVSK